MAEPEKSPEEAASSNAIGIAGWIAIVVLAGFFIAAIAYAVHAWNALAGVSIPPMGWVFMGMGAFFTLLVGGGLMALLFYSSRKGKDF
jgi:hypothetical protein